MMNDIFWDLLFTLCILLDDLLIFSETLEEHQRTVREVLKRLRENDLFAKAEKCEFEKMEVEYLGLLVSQGCVRMDPVKVKGIAEWPTPKCVKDVQSFLGFANFYRRFIENFGDVSRPLTMLTRKDQPFTWSDNQESAFLELKKRFTTSPILSMPDHEKPFHVEADSSDFASGAVLSQKDDEGRLHPVAYISKALHEAEQNYEIYVKRGGHYSSRDLISSSLTALERSSERPTHSRDELIINRQYPTT
jgi:hypothetical protein